MATHTITVEPLGAEVECREDQTILDACLRDGVWLPHACTHGTCGTCKAQVLDGDLDLGDASPYALLESEREEGAALLCVARPRGDVTIEGEVDVEEGVDVHPVRDFTGTLAGLDETGPNVRRLVIELDQPLAFNAGQYVQLAVIEPAAMEPLPRAVAALRPFFAGVWRDTTLQEYLFCLRPRWELPIRDFAWRRRIRRAALAAASQMGTAQ